VTVNPFTFVEGAPVNVTAVRFVGDVPLLVPVSVPALPLTKKPLASEARVVPFATFVKVTVAPETKPAPVTVTVVAVGVARSTRPAGLTEEYEGSALTTMAPVTVAVPPSSVSVML
jgi:hypothetical protein